MFILTSTIEKITRLQMEHDTHFYCLWARSAQSAVRIVLCLPVRSFWL